MKNAAEAADLLRRAGCIVTFASRGEATEDCGWKISVKNTEPKFSVFNCGTGETSVCENPMEAFTIVGCG
jgi:hypothetical protein